MSARSTWVYVDGFNLYYGALRHTRHRWMDPGKLAAHLLDAHINRVDHVKFFTAMIGGSDPAAAQRQTVYLNALEAHGVEVVKGHFLRHEVEMPLADGTGVAAVIKTEEKGSDVNLASHLLADGFQGRYEVAVVVSNDSDLVSPIQMVREILKKPVGVILPIATTDRKPSVELKSSATFVRELKRVPKGCELPDPVQVPGSTAKLHCPPAWR